ncbi:carbohydrate ABC transporter permease [Actinopolymorpha pittospori]|uniref:Multiple sugar transport system permease protein n=1 Tax=Actinopolymorpha pittospori TaxID=648752 RepID=A0A927MUM3_9ACTN|nr:sugar ABC transporter permease [Actinopolymorpha pittospori]MBE1606622.1 multiple sugar transport system permease protein [Actinopolymorpha pittospori]
MASGTLTKASTSRRSRQGRAGPRRRHNAAGAGLMAPFVILYALFLLVPTAYGVVLSFFDTGLASAGVGTFVGLANYLEAFSSDQFWSALGHTLWFTVLTSPPLVLLALAAAIMANRVSRGTWFLRLAFFAPYVLPSSVLALIWIWLYTPDLGLIGDWLGRVGLPAPSWLGDPNWAMISIAIATVWGHLGFNFVLYLAGLQEIPHEIYESASIDGASSWQQIIHITIPMLGRTTTLVAVLQVIGSLKVFDQVFLMTAGGPNFATRTAMQFIYDYGFTNFRVGYASATSMVLFLIVLAVSVVWFTLVRRQERGV